MMRAAENAKLLEKFIKEASDTIKEFHEKAIQLESNPEDVALSHSLYRLCHTLKGNAVFFGLERIKKTASSLESILDAAKGRETGKELVDLLWDGIGFLGKDIEILRRGEECPGSSAEQTDFSARATEFCERIKSSPVKFAQDVKGQGGEYFYCQDTDVTRIVFIINSYLEYCALQQPNSLVTSKFQIALNMLRNIFLKKKMDNEVTQLEKMMCDFESFTNDCGCPDKSVIKLLVNDFMQVMGSLKKTSSIAAFSLPRKAFCPESSVFKVEEREIKELMGMVESLEKAKGKFRELQSMLLESDTPDHICIKFQEALNNLSFLSQSMLRAVIKLKLISPELFLEKSRRLVMALAKSCGKEVDIEVECKNVMVEKRNLEVLEKVFIHILRNCVDHGIESPQERAKAGKDSRGRIKISITESEDCLVLECSDDGRGVNKARLKKVAAEKGIIDREQLASISDEQAVRLIFCPGISTKLALSDISGRGIGMDIVFSEVNKAGGSIDVSSQDGKGTQIAVRLPTSLQARTR